MLITEGEIYYIKTVQIGVSVVVLITYDIATEECFVLLTKGTVPFPSAMFALVAAPFM